MALKGYMYSVALVMLQVAADLSCACTASETIQLSK